MVDGPVAGNSAAAVAEPISHPASGQAASASGGTPSQNGQAANQAQSAPAEESFSNIDPETLPPELKAVYKNLQGDYTKKTQSAAEHRKKAEAYDKISQDQRFVEYWKDPSRAQKAAEAKEQKVEVEKRLGERITDEELEKALQSKDGFLELIAKVSTWNGEKSQKKIDELEQKLSIKDAQDVVSSYATELDKEGKPVRPDFDSLDEDQLITGYLQINKPENHSEQAYVQRLNEAYGWAKTVSQKYYEKGKAEALQIIQKKAAASTEPPTNAAKGAYTGPNPKTLSAKESFQLAKQGIRVPRDD